MQSRMAVKQTRDHYAQNNGEKRRRVFKWMVMGQCTSGKWYIWVLISLRWGEGGCCHGQIFLSLDVAAWWIENDFVMTQDALWLSKTSSIRPTIIPCSSVNYSIFLSSWQAERDSSCPCLYSTLLIGVKSTLPLKTWCQVSQYNSLFVMIKYQKPHPEKLILEVENSINMFEL